MHMHCTSLKPTRSLGQATNLSILAAIKHTLSPAKSFHDTGIRVMPAVDIT